MDLQEYRNAPDARTSTRPKDLVISIELPLCKSAAGVDLDIFEEKLTLTSEKPAYKLDLKLPYPVDDENGSAKFDKSKKALVVTLPVIQSETPKIPSFFDEHKMTEQSDVPALIEELPPLEDISEVKEHADEDLPPLEDIEVEQSEIQSTDTPLKQDIKSAVAYSLPEYTFSQDSESVTVVFHVRNINDQSVNKSFPSPGECRVKFLSVGSGGFPMHYSFYCKFEVDCKIAAEHTITDINSRNMTLTLLKKKSCRKLWNRMTAGIDNSSTEDKLFVTSDTLQEELDQLQQEGETMGCTDDTQQTDGQNADGQATDGQNTPEIQVTEMNEKKLTLNIKKAVKSFNEEEEESYMDDTMTTTGIEVIHSHRVPSLHGILKQRSVSESSEDHSAISSGESPTSLSPRDSDGVKRSVTFNSRVDKTTYKTNAAPSSMKQALKSKRRRNRKREEKKCSRENRRRHNSTGSECSSCDEHDGRHSSESHSEDDVDVEQLAQQIEETGKKVEDCGVIVEDQEENEDKTEDKVDMKDEGGDKVNVKHSVNDESKTPGYQIQSDNVGKASNKLAQQVKSKLAEKTTDVNDSDDDVDDERTMNGDVNVDSGKETSNGDNDVKTSVKSDGKQGENDLKVEEAAKVKSGETTQGGDKTSAIKGDNQLDGSKKKKGSKGVKFAEDPKSKEKSENGDGDKKTDVEPVKSDVETELRWNETNKQDPYNEHRTQCAFNFSNNVMFDLDID
ncbi:Protein kintoun [Mactra antiquata]